MRSPHFEMESPFAEAWGTLRLLEPADASRRHLRQQLQDGSYGRPFVVDDGTTRSLFFNMSFVQSSMRLAAPDALDMRYTQKMMAFLLFNASPRDIVLLGLGGGSLAKFCYRQLPRTRITAAEIDPDVIAWREQFLVPADDARFAVVCADAWAFMQRSPRGVDVVLADAFDREGLPPALGSREFLQTVLAKLSANGILSMNLAGERSRYDAVIDTARAVFDGRVIVVDVRDDGNSILYAFRNPLFEPRWRQLAPRAHELKARFGLDFPAFVRKLEQAAKRGWQLRFAVDA